MPQVPALSPFPIPQMICPNCSKSCEPVPNNEGGKLKRITQVVYSCVNEETNCGWEFKANLSHAMGDGPHAIEPGKLKKLREEAKAIKSSRQARDHAMTEVVALLPKLKAIVKAFEDDAVQQSPALASKSAEPPAGNLSQEKSA